ncbi:MAG: hypothetical protein RJA81_494, partial [Planctomycetota bacterium]
DLKSFAYQPNLIVNSVADIDLGLLESLWAKVATTYSKGDDQLEAA